MEPKEIVRTSKIIIEDDVPVPAFHFQRGRSATAKWGFMNDMKEGQSFTLDEKDCNIKKEGDNLRAYAYSQGYKVVVRTEKKGVIRVWKQAGDAKLRSGRVGKTVPTSTTSANTNY